MSDLIIDGHLGEILPVTPEDGAQRMAKLRAEESPKGLIGTEVHEEADRILLGVLLSLGQADIVREFTELGKWYE